MPEGFPSGFSLPWLLAAYSRPAFVRFVEPVLQKGSVIGIARGVFLAHFRPSSFPCQPLRIGDTWDNHCVVIVHVTSSSQIGWKTKTVRYGINLFPSSYRENTLSALSKCFM